MIFHTQAELDACLSEWVEILSLQEWVIHATVSPSEHIPGDENVAGMCRVVWPIKTARIWLLDSAEWRGAMWEGFEQDHEKTLVHELRHLRQHILKPDDPVKYDLWEQEIETDSRILLRLKRANPERRLYPAIADLHNKMRSFVGSHTRQLDQSEEGQARAYLRQFQMPARLPRELCTRCAECLYTLGVIEEEKCLTSIKLPGDQCAICKSPDCENTGRVLNLPKLAAIWMTPDA